MNIVNVDPSSVIIVKAGGPQGLPGPPGVWSDEAGITFVRTEFSYSDIATGYRNIGTVSLDRPVECTFCEIVTPFDGDLIVTVGDDGAQGRLMAAANVHPQQAGLYRMMNNYNYSLLVMLKIFFTLGETPIEDYTQGAGNVTIKFF